jgi:hypothetical protein
LKLFSKFLLLVGVLLWNCHSEDFHPQDSGEDLMPMKVGSFIVYNIDETRYSEVAPVQKSNYQLRVSVIDSFPNDEGTVTYVLTRNKRLSASASWQNIDTWSARPSATEIVVNEQNVSFVKLSFPIKNGSKWNGNKFNTIGEDEYTVIAHNEPAVFGGISFDRTTTVLEEDNDDHIVFLDQRKSVYARGVGLVYRELTQLNYCTLDNCLGQQKINNGLIYKQEISEYGNL